MTAGVETGLPGTAEATRAALYAGRIFKADPTAATLALVAAARDLLAAELGGPDVRERAVALAPDRLFAAIGRLRRLLFTDAAWHDGVRAVLGAYGFDPAGCAFDPLRLRVVLHLGHERPEAAPVYLRHRDTWYAHPQALVTGWIPLDDLEEDETFLFFPERFDRPVPNDSETFDYDEWVRDGWSRKIGWQRGGTGGPARFPAMTEGADPGAPLGFSCRRAELLLFSGAHLHATRPQATGRARFSLDFRFAHLGDAEAGIGAPGVDNRSAGSALRDYVRGGPSASASARARSAFSAKPPGTTA